VSEAAILWIVGTALFVQMAVIGFVVRMMLSHSKDCRDFRVEQAKEQGRTNALLERMASDIGDHEHGLRGQYHELAKMMSPVFMDWERQREREGR
jgi:hypothetical protein